MARYSFLTTWVLGAPIERVFAEIYDSESWPGWWRGVEEATKLVPGDADGVGSIGRYRWRSRIPYPVTFEVAVTRVERPHLLEGRASGGLEGTGRWRLHAGAGDTTAVTYEWDVEVQKRWMRTLSPVLGAAFRWNHDTIMRWGGEGLAARLDAPLLAAS